MGSGAIISRGAHSRVLVGKGQWEARVQTLEPNPWMHEVSTRGHGTRLTRLLTRQDRLEELLMMGLRTACGISDQDWRVVSGGVGLVDTFAGSAETARLLDAGLLLLDESCLRATKAGMNVADSLVSSMLPQLRERTSS
ncbi:radical S-adenosyl methionine domain-containing protein 1, mitochondrial-like [Rhipicephalus sanguineus]|uniref:radical S-adenosyl methionine domain-containing protein 1, mitochondrial-like n=1 Tax=Rhipicephalus sanguineus TaxID=34632 RepID=UPI0020C20399|nr:radical S-adenosyl methionine domain-containing protein 1, mitochondrial-like [Rhipicephalus sanguineus]